MKYKDYLRSEHWKQLKREVLSRRSFCQNCTSKSKLLLHHKNYDCLFKEKDSDLIVMCFDCHHKQHKKRNFKIKGIDLNFTSVKNENKEYYKIEKDSSVKLLCNRCGEEHGIIYKTFSNGQKHMAIICKNSKPRTQYIKYVDGLPIRNL